MKQPRIIGAVSFVAEEYPFPVAYHRPAHFAFPVSSLHFFPLSPCGALIDNAEHDFAGRNRSKNLAFVRTISGLLQS